MSEPIVHILDENTANQIAAGEVVERPASVVKELVENAIDANSKNITIEICDGGLTSIRVTDDGQGMSQQDAQLAILRHATSKIMSAEDLYSIKSLGFRGEALPSIASVAKFTLITRPPADNLATSIEIEGGTICDIGEAGGAVGTTIKVANLFYNTPARRKFLKTTATESGYINDIVSKIALAHPHICFKLINNGRLVLATPGNNVLADTLGSLYGKKIVPDILPIDYAEDPLSVTGYIGKPTLLKSNRHWQTFIINRRVINSRVIAKAVDNAYQSLLPRTGYPLVLLNIDIPADSIDVNVHPQKSEVKFDNEQQLYRLIYRSIVSMLSMPATNEHLNMITTAPTLAGTKLLSSATPLSGNRQYPESSRLPGYEPQPKLWREEGPAFTTVQAAIQNETTITGLPNITESITLNNGSLALQPLGQIDNCFIVAQGAEGLYIIDQHAAHERILYDKLSQHTDRIPSQQLLVPLFIEGDPQECNLILDNQQLFYQLGFTVELAGPNLVRAVEAPVDIDPADIQAYIREILTVIQTAHQPSAADLRHACLQTAACRSAIKAGDTLNMRQMQVLLSELYTTTLPYTCPHGRPTIIKFSPGDLAKMFKRTNYGG